MAESSKLSVGRVNPVTRHCAGPRRNLNQVITNEPSRAGDPDNLLGMRPSQAIASSTHHKHQSDGRARNGQWVRVVSTCSRSTGTISISSWFPLAFAMISPRYGHETLAHRNFNAVAADPGEDFVANAIHRCDVAAIGNGVTALDEFHAPCCLAPWTCFSAGCRRWRWGKRGFARLAWR